MQVNLRGKGVIVTGASSGIGRDVALRFARRGAKLMLVSRRKEALEQVARETRDYSPAVEIAPVDVTDRNAVEATVKEAERLFGGIDIVVAAAGQYFRVHGLKVKVEDLQRSMEVNFFGTVNVLLAALPNMLKRRSGNLIAISSVDGKKGLPWDTPYVSAKFAVTGFMDSMRQDLRGSGVVLTTILPGRVDTPMIGGLDVPWISGKIQPARVTDAVERALRGRNPEIVVPLLGPKTLLWSAAFSPRFADMLIRFFRLEGKISPELNSLNENDSFH